MAFYPLSPEDLEFFTALANAIKVPEKVTGLDRFEKWKQLEPIDISEPWDRWKE
jgi:hypothetical protein